jgi:DNA repair protein RadC
LNEFGTLSGVIKAPPKKVAKILGVGENSVVLLSAIGELCVRVSKERASKRTAYRTEEEIVELVTSHYLNETEEKFLLVCFDSGMKVRYSGFISEGDSIHTELDMKNFISKVIENDASIIVIAHNHPDGDASPSGADISTTAAISVMMRKIGVVLYDHVILSQESYLSMRSSKIFKNYFD